MYSLRIKKSSAKIFFRCLLLCLGLFRVCLVSNTIYRAYSFAILAVLFFSVGLSKRRVRRNWWAICLGVIIGGSVIWQSRSLTGIFHACTYFLEFTTPFLFVDHLTSKYGFASALRGMLRASFVICTMMDLSVIAGMDLDKTHYQNLTVYLFGNKFMVAYLHMQTLSLMAKYRKLTGRSGSALSNPGLLAYGVCGIALCAAVNCATGILGNLCILVLITFPCGKTVKILLSKPLTMMAALLASNILVIGSDVLLQIPAVQGVILHVLKKDLTLTGRFRIYAMLPDLFKGHWAFGYGYNSDIFAGLIGYGNAQNGILQYVLDCGLIGAGTLLFLWVHSVRGIRRKEVMSWPLVSAVYGFMVCSLVEVCFKFNFIVILAFLSSSALITKDAASS